MSILVTSLLRNEPVGYLQLNSICYFITFSQLINRLRSNNTKWRPLVLPTFSSSSQGGTGDQVLLVTRMLSSSAAAPSPHWLAASIAATSLRNNRRRPADSCNITRPTQTSPWGLFTLRRGYVRFGERITRAEYSWEAHSGRNGDGLGC